MGVGVEIARSDAAEELAFGQDADHRGVVGAESGFGKTQGEALAVAGRAQLATQPAVAGDAARGGDAGDAEAFGGANGFGDENVHDRGLDAGAKVAPGL